MLPVSPYSNTPSGSTASLSEKAQLHSFVRMLRIHPKFLLRLKKSVMKTFQTLTEAYGDETLSRAHVFECYERFSGRRVSVKDEPAGRPRSAITDQNIAKILKSCGKGTHVTSLEEDQAPEGPSKNLVTEL
ncbi:hypothetical protein TNCV_335401 [Trichonephila clavipes]|nr:hypothetical protein TNCV_335401 [Trichonephila clavipes]